MTVGAHYVRGHHRSSGATRVEDQTKLEFLWHDSPNCPQLIL